MIENSRQSEHLIEKGKELMIYYFIVESNHDCISDIDIGYIAYIYN